MTGIAEPVPEKKKRKKKSLRDSVIELASIENKEGLLVSLQQDFINLQTTANIFESLQYAVKEYNSHYT